MKAKRWLLTAAATLAAVAAIGRLTVKPASAATPPAPVHTAQVERKTLSAMVSQPGILTYRARSDGSPYSVINHAGGTYTKLPADGEVIRQGHVLYRVDDRPVVLLDGSTPAYRTLTAGASGPDVAELNADLVALGYATRAQLRPRSASFGSVTTMAVAKLQAALGVTQSGNLKLGDAVFEPSSVRVTNVSAQLGSSSRSGETVMQGTSTRREIQVALDASQQTSLAVADKVTVTLPNNKTTPGVVSSVGAVAICPSRSGSDSNSAAPGTDTCASSSGNPIAPTITVVVIPSDPAATGTWDQAPVQVGITTASVPDAMVVPVTALLARSGGGYAVEVVDAGAGNHLVPVSLGLFDDADGLVQLTSSGLVAGQEVVVAST